MIKEKWKNRKHKKKGKSEACKQIFQKKTKQKTKKVIERKYQIINQIKNSKTF